MDDNNLNKDTIYLPTILYVLKKQYVLILSIFAIALISAITLNNFSSNVYKTSFVLRTKLLSYIEADQILNNYVKWLTNQQELPKSLEENKYDSDILKYLNKVEVSTIKKEEKESIFNITIFVTKKDVIYDINNLFVEGLNNNEYVREQLKTEREELKTIKRQIESELKAMKRLKTEVSSALERDEATGNILYSPFKMHTELIRLKERKLKLANQIDELVGFSTIDRPIIPESPYRPNSLKNFIIISFVGLIVGFFLAYIVEYVKILRSS